MVRGPLDLGGLHRVEKRVGLETRVKALLGQQLPEHDPQRKHVETPIEIPTTGHLLGRHVAKLAADLALPGALGAALGLRNAEVGQANRAIVAEQNVLRRDVSVDHAEDLAVLVLQLVGGVQALGDARDDPGGEPGIETAVAARESDHELGEGAAVHVLHRQVVETVLLAELVDTDDVGMAKADRDQRLVDEPAHRLPILGEVLVDHLEREGLSVLSRHEHRRHAPGRNAVDELIAPDGLTRLEHRRRGYGESVHL